MRAVVISRHGGPEVLAVRELPDPAVEPGRVRIEVRAAGINFADLMARSGLYPDAPPLPSVVSAMTASGASFSAPTAAETMFAPCSPKVEPTRPIIPGLSS